MSRFLIVATAAPVAAAVDMTVSTDVDSLVETMRDDREISDRVAVDRWNRNARRAVLVRDDRYVRVGSVRLENREQLERVVSGPPWRDDLTLLTDLVLQQGPVAVRAAIGEFAFVIWDTLQRRVIAGRDALGIRTLYENRRTDRIVIGSRAADVQRSGEYDREYIAEFLLNGQGGSFDRTIYVDVRPVAPGTIVERSADRRNEIVFWCPGDFAPQPIAESDAVDEFRRLLFAAVRTSIAGSSLSVWSRLSGGLDSSSIVSIACSPQTRGAVASGLVGTVTVVDRLGRGDETDFVDLVTSRYGVRNVRISDPWLWRDDSDQPPPLTDLPRPNYAFYGKDRQTCDMLLDNGATVLLCGLGADHILDVRPSRYISDSIARGRIRDGASHIAQWAVATRQSAWRLGFRSAILPFAPRFLRRAIATRARPVPSWIHPDLTRQYHLRDRIREVRQAMVGPGMRFASEVEYQVNHIAACLRRDTYEDAIDVRYPFLHRPLVEFTLSLPIEYRARPGTTKWILREAMRGVLPERIRLRNGKGTIGARLLWSLSHERERVKDLLTDPVLSQLGCVDTQRLTIAFNRAQSGRTKRIGRLLNVIGLESWLRVRSGRW